MVRYVYSFFCVFLIALVSCIQDAPQNPEADILTFSFPADKQKADSRIYNTYIVSYPKRNVDFTDPSNAPVLTVTPGATWEWIDRTTEIDTLFYIKVVAEDKNYTKLYAITRAESFPDLFIFDTWVKYSPSYLYENPKDSTLQWFSSNNGAATAFANPNKPAGDYPVRKIPDLSGGFSVELQTTRGPGKIAGGIRYIPCLAGSLYAGDFNILNGLRDPLASTLFGLPFDKGKPVSFHGYYKYTRGDGPFITGTSESDYHEDYDREDFCDIYAILFEITDLVKYLDGNTIPDQSNWVAKARIPDQSYTYPENILKEFYVPFVYYKNFSWDKLLNNQYKMAVVFTSATRGAYYEGRVGNRLVVDNVSITYDKNPE